MKTWVSIFSFLILVTIPAISQANLKGATINWVISYGEDPAECAAEVEITDIEGGVINGSERLAIDGLTWGDFSGLPTSGYSIGTKFSFGTDAFQVRANYNVDVLLDETLCEDIMQGDVLSFDGSFNPDLSSLMLDTPMMHSALVLQNGNYNWIDLTQNSILITNLAGETTTFGSGPVINNGGGGGGGSTSNGGCFLAAGAPAAGALAWGTLLLPLIPLGLWARRRS